MPEIGKVGPWNIVGVRRAGGILYACGKDMARRCDLHHWDNSRIVTDAIALLGGLKNNLYLVKDEDRYVATFQTRVDGITLHLSKLATLPEAAGRGIGSFCLERIEAMAREAGCVRIALEVYDRSAHAVEFYRRRGFTDAGRMSTRKYTEIKMEKAVSPLG